MSSQQSNFRDPISSQQNHDIILSKRKIKKNKKRPVKNE